MNDEIYSISFEKAAIGMCIVNPDGKFVRVNETLCQMLGYTEKEFLSKTFNDVTHPEDRDIGLEIVQKLVNGETEKAIFEKRYLHRNGTPVYASITTSILQDSKNQPLYFITQIMDISTQKKAESDLKNALQESQFVQKEITALYEASRSIPLHRKFEGSARKIFDICRELIGARSGYVALLSDDGSENEVLFLEAGGLPCDVDPELPMPIRGLREVAYRTKDVAYDNNFAESKWVNFMPEGHVELKNVLFSPLNIENKTVGLIGLANKTGGFTERDILIARSFGDLAAVALTYAQYQEELHKSEELFRTVANYTYDWEYWQLPNNNLKYISPSCERISGYTRDEFIDNPEIIDSMIVDENKEIWKSHKYGQKHHREQIEFKIITKKGDVRWIGHECNPIYNDNGEYLGRRVSNRDITGQKNAEEKIKKSLAEKETLLRELYHRTKNNMQVIIALLELQTIDSENDYLTQVLQDTKNRIHAMSLVHKMLYEAEDLSHINLKSYIGELIESLMVELSISKTNISYVPDMKDVCVLIDTAIPCGLILNELITNSFKHAFVNKKKGELIIELSKSAAGEIYLKVSDNGIGFKKGFDIKQDSKLGLKNVVSLVERQLKGSVKFNAKNGLSCEIIFKDDMHSVRV